MHCLDGTYFLFAKQEGGNGGGVGNSLEKHVNSPFLALSLFVTLYCSYFLCAYVLIINQCQKKKDEGHMNTGYRIQDREKPL